MSESKSKGKVLRKQAIFIVSIIVLLMIGIAVFFRNIPEITNRIQGKSMVTYSENEQISTSKVHNVYMLINELYKEDNTSVSGSKVRIILPEGLNMHLYNTSTSFEISPSEDDETYEIPEDGAKLKIEGIEEANTYDIKIEQVETVEGYTSTFKSATIEIDAQNGEIVSFVKEIIKSINGQDITIQGSEEETAIFMYEDEDNHNIKITGNTDVELYYIMGSLSNELSEEELNSAQWETYNKEEGIQVEKNCIIYSKSKYKTGEYSEISKIYIVNIDKKEPTITVTTKTEEEEDETSITVEITDEETEEYGASGIVAYALTQTDEEPTQYIECSNTTKIDTEIGAITKNGTYYLWAKDQVGNIGKTEFVINNIKINVVAIILDSPYEELNGMEYTSMSSLLAELKEKQDNQTETTEENSTIIIQIVHDIKNEAIEFEQENLDIILDLNGYTIASKSTR